MQSRLDRVRRLPPLILGMITLASVVVLLVWDAQPALFSARAHDVLAAFPLGLIAVAYLAYQAVRRPAPAEMVKAILLAAAFGLWAANQFWPNLPEATLFNDLAIALFVLDVFLVIAGWPSTNPDEGFAESYGKAPGDRRS
jgi:peptidoglycan/LPS O-acetylase OafA/YrhL